MAITFHPIVQPNDVATYLANTINGHLLAGRMVFWLVPGGSAIPMVVAAAQMLANAPLKNLTVSLTDERYGPVGHADSNWSQLEAAGFALPGATMIPVLNDEDMQDTIDHQNDVLDNCLDTMDVAVGLFGLGADGHTAGILPNSPAVESPQFAVGYNAETYQRITMTAKAIGQLDEAIIYAVGSAKWPVIQQLLTTEMPSAQQPAQALKKAARTTLFSDYAAPAAPQVSPAPPTIAS